MKYSNRLFHPVFLFSLFLLIINDHILKASFPGLISGKLSDFSGLFAFTWSVLAIIQYTNNELSKKARWIANTVIAAGFTWFKSPASNSFISWWSDIFYAIQRHVDYTDLTALISIPLASYLFISGTHQFTIRHSPTFEMLGRLSIIGVSVFAFAATSTDDDFPNTSLFRGLNVDQLDTNYVVQRNRQEILDQYFDTASVNQLAQPLDSSLCLRTQIPINAFSRFSSGNILCRLNLNRISDTNTLVAIEELSNLSTMSEAGVDYNEDLDRRMLDQERLDSLSIDSIFILIENSLIVPMRLSFDTQDRIRALSCR